MRYISNIDVLRKKRKKKGTSVEFEPTSGAYECRVYCMAVKSGEFLHTSHPPPPHWVNMLAVDLLRTRNNKTH